MKKCASIILTLSVMFLFSVSVFGQKENFNGTWRLDRSKSTLVENTPILVRLTVQLRADSLLTERVYDVGDGSEYPFNENIALDGSESKTTIYEMPRKIKALWSDAEKEFLVESTTSFNGAYGPEDFNSSETWKADNGAKTLTISFKNTTSAGKSEGVLVYTKAE